MFTGIIEQIGFIRNISPRKDLYRLEILPERQRGFPKKGDSISVSGACLTLVGIKNGLWSFDIMAETYKNTSLSHLKYKDIINIERALGMESRVDGHFVSGHVDKVQKITCIKKQKDPYIEISLSEKDMIYVVEKGSIAIDGISLTIADVHDDRIRIYIIPHTLENTNLKYKNTGSLVNVEFDILGKYAQKRLLYKDDKKSLFTEEFLKVKGII